MTYDHNHLNLKMNHPQRYDSTGATEILEGAHALVGGSHHKLTVVMQNQRRPMIQHHHHHSLDNIIERPEANHPRHSKGMDDTKQFSLLDTTTSRRPRSSSGGLDLLVALAEKERCNTEVISTSASSSEDEESMPPPPPRRPRSNSSPAQVNGARMMIVPDGFLEAELAELRRSRRSPPSIPEHKEWNEEDYDSEHLLRDARTRLLEELAGKAGVYPHELTKYKDVSDLMGMACMYDDIHSLTHSTDLQPKRLHWYLYTSRTRGDHCQVPRQANPTQLEQARAIQLPQGLGGQSRTRQGTLCETRGSRPNQGGR